MQNPLISIIIPTYNRVHLIGETLDSVLMQTYANWECIVVDDGSTDGTETLLRNYCKRDNRIQYHNRPNNRIKGGNSARNYGFEISKGEYIQWFDSDDLMYDVYLEKRIDLFNKFPNTDIVFCAFNYFNKNGLQLRISNNLFSGNIIEDLIYEKITYSPLSYLLKKKIIKNFLFDEKLQKAQDLDYFFKVFTSLKNIEIKHISEVLFKVRKHKKTISANPDKSGGKLNSRFIVNYRILEYFLKIKNDKAILIYKEHCLMDLKNLLDNKNYNLVIINLLNFSYLSFRKKIFLICCVLSQYLFGKGAYQFKKR